MRTGRFGALAASLMLGLGSVALAEGTPERGADAAPTVERTAYLMGTRATLAIRTHHRARGLAVLDALLESLEEAEAELSTWRADSRLGALNRQRVGEAAPFPEPLCALLVELAKWRDETGGAFDPAVGRLVEAWDLRGQGRLPTAEALARARRDTGLVHVGVERSPCRLTRRRDVLVDAGAFGKGAALDRARSLAGPEAGPWMVDLGGQVAVHASADAPWPVALAHPRQRDVAVLQVTLAEGSLATSGGSERDLRLDGETLGHVLDPRTGRPVSRPGSVTVWHPRAFIADVLSTALLVMGPEAGVEWAEERGVAACFLEPQPDGVAVRSTTAFRERFPSAP